MITPDSVTGYLVFTCVLCICFYFLGRYEMKSYYGKTPRQLSERERKFADLFFEQFKLIDQYKKEIDELKKEVTK